MYNIMAKIKRNKKDNSGELFSRLGRKGESKSKLTETEDEFLQKEEYIESEPSENDEYDSIDVSGAGAEVESDSDLDISELLRKYMPEYSDDAEDGTASSVLSQLKITRQDTNVENGSADDKLISVLDSAFSQPDAATPETLSDETVEESVTETEEVDEKNHVEKHEHKKNKGLFGSTTKNKGEDDLISEYEFDSDVPDEVVAEDTDDTNFVDEEEPEENVEPEPKPRKKLFSFGAKQRKSRRKPVETEEAEVSEETFDEQLDLSEENSEKGNEPASSESEPVDEVKLDLNDESEEKTEEANDTIPEDSEVLEEPEEPIDSTDMNLMIAFGLDSQGNKKADKAKQLGDRLEAKQTSRESKRLKLDHAEFVDKTQTPKIRREFRSRALGLWIKLAACVVFTVLLMIFENIEVLSKLFTGTTKQFGGAFDPAVYPVVYIMVSLQLMLLACLCAIDQIADGFKYLFRGTPKPESLTSILTVVGILYSIILARVVVPSHEPVMFNFVVALFALFTLIYAIYNNRREMMNFRIVANKKPKHIVRRLLDEESEGEAKAFEDTEDVCDVMKIEKTDFIDGFFGRLCRPDPTTNRFMAALLSASAAIAVLFGILVNFRGGDADSILGTIYASMLIIAPLSIYVTFSYPFYRANVVAQEYDSAIIGETSLAEYSNASIISFDDKNVFPSYSVKVQNIRIYNNARIDRVLYYAASVFAYAGGPLQDVFEIATVEMGHLGNVKIFDTEAGFLATQVDGVNIIFGSYEALRKRNFDIPDSAAEDDVDLSDELSIMYMFREHKLVAKMYIKYVMDADIDLILKQFSGSGLYVCVRTFDPNIDERMIARKLNMKRMPLKIVRYASAEEVTSYEKKVDSGLVTCGSPKSLLQVISYCEKVLRTKKTNIALSVLSVMIGAAILVLLLLSGSMAVVNSLYIAIYQIIWMIPLAISSRMFIR